MDILENPVCGIQNAKHEGKLSFSFHALRKMLERNIRVEQIEQALNSSEVEILENYPQVGRPSPECLIVGKDDSNRYMHVLVAYPQAEVVTAYIPELPWWENERKRGK